MITIVAGQNFVFNVPLSVGGVQTQVEVNAGAGVTTVETDTASISTTLGDKEVTGYALKRQELLAAHHDGSRRQ